MENRSGGSRPWALVLTVVGALAWGAPAWADGEAPASAPDGLGDRGTHASSRTYAEGVPWLRLELGLTALMTAPSKLKAGPEGTATAFEPTDDAGLPTHLTLAGAAYLDVKVFDWASIGGFYWGYRVRGPKRAIDEAIGLGSEVHAEGSRVRTELDLQHAELSLRFVWKHTERIHIWFGIGASWFSYRVALRGAEGGSSARIDSFFAPALTYSVHGKLPGMSLGAFLTSGIAVGYVHFPSVVVASRTGLFYDLGGGVQVSLSVTAHNGFISKEKGITRAEVTSGYRHRRVRWSAVGLELGVAWTY